MLNKNTSVKSVLHTFCGMHGTAVQTNKNDIQTLLIRLQNIFDLAARFLHLPYSMGFSGSPYFQLWWHKPADFGYIPLCVQKPLKVDVHSQNKQTNLLPYVEKFSVNGHMKFPSLCSAKECKLQAVVPLPQSMYYLRLAATDTHPCTQHILHIVEELSISMKTINFFLC